MNKLSIIIPVYNGEKYIGRLLDELLIQIKDDGVEIIIVENGSSDNTLSIIKNYSKNNKSIKVLQSEKGVSKARNIGIKNANNEYIMFVDADDFLLDGAIDIIFKDIQTSKELYMYGFVKGKYNEKIKKCKSIKYDYKYTNISDFINWIMSKPTLRASVWSKVYKKNIIIENKIFFNEILRYSEDSEFLLRYLKEINNAYISEKCIYKYVLSENSAMRSNNPERINQYLLSMKYTEEEFKKTDYKNSIYKYFLTHLNIIMVHDIFIYKKNIEFKNDINRFKKIFDNSLFEDSLKHISIKDCFCKEFLVELMLKIRFNYIAYLLCYIKSYINQK